jgi:hypothetical protein
MSSEILTKNAAQILNCFGYVNMKPEYLTALECSENNGIYDYILVGFQDKLFNLKFKNDNECSSWTLSVKKWEV